jgi:hypothetical protein
MEYGIMAVVPVVQNEYLPLVATAFPAHRDG